MCPSKRSTMPLVWGVGGLQPLKGVGCVIKAFSALHFVDCAFTHVRTQCQVAAVSELSGISAWIAGMVHVFLFKAITKTRLPGGLLGEVKIVYQLPLAYVAMNSGYRFEPMQS